MLNYKYKSYEKVLFMSLLHVRKIFSLFTGCSGNNRSLVISLKEQKTDFGP